MSEIRPAILQDCPELVKLYYEFHEFHARGVSERLKSLGAFEQDWSGLYDALAKLVEKDDVALLVALVNEVVVGCIEVYLRPAEPEAIRVIRAHAHVQSLMVTEARRGHGIGRELLDAAHDWAKQKGAEEIELDIWEFDEGPLHFYERYGYRTIRRTMVAKL